MVKINIEFIKCPLCDEAKFNNFAEENGFTAVKCSKCGLVYVNPRPVFSTINEAVKTGLHNEVEGGRNVIVHRISSKINLYRKILIEMFSDIWQRGEPISWLDIGAGYGEFVEALATIAPLNSIILGIEPMQPKAFAAQKRGLNIKNIFLSDVDEKYDIVSIIDVLSHIPDINSFIKEIKQVLKPDGYFFIETGNIADLKTPKEVPSELDLPDHLIFVGEKQIELWLTSAGFKILSIKRRREDTILNFLKNIVKKILGRKLTLALPYTSSYRSLIVKAQLLVN